MISFLIQNSIKAVQCQCLQSYFDKLFKCDDLLCGLSFFKIQVIELHIVSA